MAEFQAYGGFNHPFIEHYESTVQLGNVCSKSENKQIFE